MSAYEDIKAFYGDRRAERSGVLLMQHIDDGLVVMEELGASILVQDAYCLHPMFQADDALLENLGELLCLDSGTLLRVLEYRNQANRWLSDKVRTVNGRIEQLGKPSPGPLLSVKKMLIADKVQNYKDFCTYHRSTHPRAEELTHYFGAWFEALGVTADDYERYSAAIERARHAE